LNGRNSRGLSREAALPARLVNEVELEGAQIAEEVYSVGASER